MILIYNLKCKRFRSGLWRKKKSGRIIHKLKYCPSYLETFTAERHTQHCARVFTYMVAFIASVRCCCTEARTNIYIGFRKQLLRERSLLLFTQIQNKETLQRLPVIDMWACFFQGTDWKK